MAAPPPGIGEVQRVEEKRASSSSKADGRRDRGGGGRGFESFSGLGLGWASRKKSGARTSSTCPFLFPFVFFCPYFLSGWGLFGFVGRALTEEWLDGEACDRCCPSVLGPFDPRALPFIGGLRALHGFIASPRLMRVASHLRPAGRACRGLRGLGCGVRRARLPPPSVVRHCALALFSPSRPLLSVCRAYITNIFAFFVLFRKIFKTTFFLV